MEECRHIRVNGKKCRAAALRNSAWCYFHEAVYREHIEAHRLRTRRCTDSITLAPTSDYGCIPVAEPAAARGELPIVLPLIEDISSIQLAISRILHALAANTIDPKRAGLLLYGLQIAAQNQPKRELSHFETVSEVGQTLEGIDVAQASPNEPCTETFPQMAARLRLNLQTLRDIEEEEDNGEDEYENDGEDEQDQDEEEDEDEENEDDEDEDQDEEDGDEDGEGDESTGGLADLTGNRASSPGTPVRPVRTRPRQAPSSEYRGTAT